MIQQDLCRQCNQRRDCGKVYKQLGKNEGPPIVKKVILAFLLPLIVFIASLAVFEKTFSGAGGTGQAPSALSFAAALLLTFACIFVIKAISNKCGQEK